MRQIATIACLGFLIATAPATAIEGNRAAVALSTADAVGTSGRAGQRDLAAGAPVFYGDKVMTGPAGEAQLLFSDGTRIVLGPNASLALDWPDAAAARGELALRALVGAFRVVGPRYAAQGQSIDTPQATIRARGASFDFTVYGGRTSLVLVQGAATLCGEAGNCTTVERSCEVVYGDAATGITIVG